VRDVSGLLMLLRTTADILAQVGGGDDSAAQSLTHTMIRLKIVPPNNELLPKALLNFNVEHLEQLMIR
jgi:hypothetical protein